MNYMDAVYWAGRILFGGFWLYNAWQHFSRTKDMAGYAASKGVPAPTLAILGSGALLLIGGVGILFNYYVTLALWCLVLFLVAVTFSMHRFWSETDPTTRAVQRIQFGKNLALLGAIFLLLTLV
jgi:putative oxidoreductase